jgi:hypothetical protein
MRLENWEATMQEIVDECSRVQTTTGKVLIAWRVRLEQEPTNLQPFQIDQIVREVRRRLGVNS